MWGGGDGDAEPCLKDPACLGASCAPDIDWSGRDAILQLWDGSSCACERCKACVNVAVTSPPMARSTGAQNCSSYQGPLK